MSYPPGINRLVYDYEINAFCRRGEIQGEWLGRLTWGWTRYRGGPAVITVESKDRSRPSREFLDAVARFCQLECDEPIATDADKPVYGGIPCQ